MESYRILIRPLVTEKSNLGPRNSKYTFVVNKDATKEQVKRAVEERFKVRVVDVNVANFHGKSKSRGARSKGKRSDWKKAYVTLAQGDTIPELYEDLG
jgi:large subunit ribosomal protein L23